MWTRRTKSRTGRWPLLRMAAGLLLMLPAASAPAPANSSLSLSHANLSGTSQAEGGEAGSRLLLPAGGVVRVENPRGDVRVEVWGENFVSVSASVENGPGGAPAARSRGGRAGRAASRRAPAAKTSNAPLRVERSESLLSLVVPSDFGTSATRVQVLVRVPREARLSVRAGAGRVEVRGLPASLDAQTVSGDINLGLPQNPSAELTAHSLNGEVAAGLDGAPRAAREKFQTRLGAGGSAVRLFSGRGRISLDTLSPSESLAAAPVNSSARPRGDAASSAATQTPEDDDRRVALAGSTPARRRAPVLVGGGTRAPAQEATPAPATRASDEPQEVDEDEVVRVETELVTLNVSVIERSGGRGLKGLTLNDFKLYEDGAEQRVEHFETSAAPFDLLLLIDLSGSTGKVTSLIRASALRFVDAARPQDRIAVLTFAGSTNVVSPLTTDRAALRAAVGSMEPPKGDTRLYDAVNSALEYFDRHASQSRRRAVVLMSDGLDSTLPNVTGTGSTLAYEELRSRVQEFDGVLYAVWTSTEYEAFSPEDIQPETFDLVHDRMKELSEEGGGDFYAVNRLEDLAGAYERVVADLGTLYSLSYRPTNKARDGRWRTIRVRLPNHPDAVARGKRGYHAK